MLQKLAIAAGGLLTGIGATIAFNSRGEMSKSNEGKNSSNKASNTKKSETKKEN